MYDINVYGHIGGYDDKDMDSKKFADELKAANGDAVTVHINSGGGDVFEANTMSALLGGYVGRTTAVIEGLAASAASYFALTADNVVIGKTALMMIHNPYTFAAGDSADLRKTADFLDKVRSTIVSQYVDKTGEDASTIEGWMDDETWFTAEDAVKHGFADSVADVDVAACIDAETLAKFHHAPKNLLVAPAGGVTGETETTITANESGGKPGAGAASGETGAVSKTVCVNGQFLTYEGEPPHAHEILDSDS